MDPDMLGTRLRRWADQHRRQAQALGCPPGAKHPSLCLAVPHLWASWVSIVPVVVRRPVDEVVASLRRSGWWTEKERWEATTRLVAARDHALAGVPTIDVELQQLRAAPRSTIRRLAWEIGLEPTTECLLAAEAGVTP